MSTKKESKETRGQGLINRVLASPKASSYIIGLVGLYLTLWELAHISHLPSISDELLQLQVRLGLRAMTGLVAIE